MGPLLLFNALDYEMRAALIRRLTSLGETRIELYVIAALTVASVIVIGAALARFKRGKLVLD
jgi:hypothetical protein